MKRAKTLFAFLLALGLPALAAAQTAPAGEPAPPVGPPPELLWKFRTGG